MATQTKFSQKSQCYQWRSSVASGEVNPAIPPKYRASNLSEIVSTKLNLNRTRESGDSALSSCGESSGESIKASVGSDVASSMVATSCDSGFGKNSKVSRWDKMDVKMLQQDVKRLIKQHSSGFKITVDYSYRRSMRLNVAFQKHLQSLKESGSDDDEQVTKELQQKLFAPMLEMDAVVVNIMKTLCELISSFTDLRNQIGGQSDNAAAKIEAIKKQLDVASVGFTQKYQMLIDFLYYDMNIGSVEKILRDLAHQCVEKSIPIEDSAVSPETLRVCIESLRFHAINYIDCSSAHRFNSLVQSSHRLCNVIGDVSTRLWTLSTLA